MIIKVKTETPYNVIVENGAMDRIADILSAVYRAGTKVMIISDDNVHPIYGNRVRKNLESKGYRVFDYIFPAGEESKNINTIMEMYQALSEANFTKADIILTLGGGVTGDMGGFAAATFLRGIDYIHVPTSLLAQVDSSIGGKTGIDLEYGKNLVGAFYDPKIVITDPAVLKTLPKANFVDGMAEVVKYGCIMDTELFHDLETGMALRNLEHTICRCIECKRDVVQEDKLDKGRRMILNFGHTFGHALEKLYGFSSEMPHGKAVAIGMATATRISETLKMTERGTSARLENLLELLELPTKSEYPIDKIIDATAMDKKSTGKKLNLIFLKDIGETFVHSTERNYLILRCKIMEEQMNRNA